jgi:hypothetical protein
MILAEIRRIATGNGGKPPGAQLFRSATGIIESKWRGIYWARWGDALGEAGYSANEWQGRLDTAQLLRRVAEITRERGAIPTYSELELMRRSDPSVPNPKTLRQHFSGRAGLIETLRSYCDGNEGFDAVRLALPKPEEEALRREGGNPDEGWVYLLKSGHYYKVGRSDQLEARVKKISIALPEATALIHAIRTDDPPGIEAYWHRRFAGRRANGEWFKLTACDIAAFSRRKFQ